MDSQTNYQDGRNDGLQTPPATYPAVPTEPQAAPAPTEGELEEANQKLMRGANWFLWIAGLSVVNSVMLLFKADLVFVVGLGASLVIGGIGQALAEELGSAVAYIAFFLSLLAVVPFVIFGIFARKGHLWAFITGMVLYALDALIMLACGDWMALGFHIFVLVCLASGARALTAARRLTRQVPVPPPSYPVY